MRDEIIQKRGYDSSIEGDDLSLKISSYPITAKYLSVRLAVHGGVICELCCGIGISLIEFSRHFDTVIGVDNDPYVIESARNNLQRNKITNYELILGGAEDLDTLHKIDADIVAYDIPYWSDHGNDAVTGKNPQLSTIIDLIRVNITKNIVIYAPSDVSYDDIAKITDVFEYQEVWINDKHDRNFIYFGDLIDTLGQSSINLTR
ncbi:MAG: S-adenosyl-L-methionine-dependent methyltransferase [Candidatus Saccharibacteria bacterium]|nr:S-adenosyl-L-methionine-dependent methyltransferase [Candidatus Saccharibacteria bacterium]